jgi:GNAT superfamily N-acetyltransferase
MTLMMSMTARRWRVRKLWPHERGAYLDHLLRLDHESRALRFGAPLCDAALTQHAARHFAVDSVMYGLVLDGQLRAVGELHGTCDIPRRGGEAAFSVETALRRRGIGAALFAAVSDAARNRRFRMLSIVRQSRSPAMRAIVRRHLGEIDSVQDGDGDDSVDCLQLLPATPATVMGELQRELAAWGEAALCPAVLGPGAPGAPAWPAMAAIMLPHAASSPGRRP